MNGRRMAAGLAVAGILIAGCSSASNTSATSGSSVSAVSAGGLTTAQQVVSSLLAPPTAPEVAPLTKAVPTGKTVALIDCPVPGCKLLYKAAAPAASLLGWKVREFDGGSTPQTYVAAVQAAIQSHPDYIMLTALQPNATIEPELAQAQKLGIPVAEVASSDQPSGPIVYSFFGPATWAQLGDHVADWVTAQSKGTANAVIFTDPTATSYLIADKAFEKELAAVCPSCKLDEQQYSQLNIGQSFPSQVVSFVQAHPDVQYLVSSTSGAWLGVPQALKAAGLAGRVKLVAALSTVSDYPLVKNGDPSYTVLAVNQAGGYFMIDALARLAVGEKIPVQPTLQEQFITPQTVGTFNNTAQWTVPDVAPAFAAAWHVKIPAGFVAQER